MKNSISKLAAHTVIHACEVNVLYCLLYIVISCVSIATLLSPHNLLFPNCDIITLSDANAAVNLEVNQPHNEIHNVEPRVDKPFSLLLKVEYVDKTPVPSLASNPEAIYEICERELIPMPFYISMLNKYECIVEYSGNLAQVARIFQ